MKLAVFVFAASVLLLLVLPHGRRAVKAAYVELFSLGERLVESLPSDWQERLRDDW